MKHYLKIVLLLIYAYLNICSGCRQRSCGERYGEYKYLGIIETPITRVNIAADSLNTIKSIVALEDTFKLDNNNPFGRIAYPKLDLINNSTTLFFGDSLFTDSITLNYNVDLYFNKQCEFFRGISNVVVESSSFSLDRLIVIEDVVLTIYVTL